MCWRRLNSAWCDVFSPWSFTSFEQMGCVYQAVFSCWSFRCADVLESRLQLEKSPLSMASRTSLCDVSLNCSVYDLISLQHTTYVEALSETSIPRGWSEKERNHNKSRDYPQRLHSECPGMEMKWLVPPWPPWSDSTQCLNFFSCTLRVSEVNVHVQLPRLFPFNCQVHLGQRNHCVPSAFKNWCFPCGSLLRVLTVTHLHACLHEEAAKCGGPTKTC